MLVSNPLPRTIVLPLAEPYSEHQPTEVHALSKNKREGGKAAICP